MYVNICFRTKDGTDWSIPCRDERLLVQWVEQLRIRGEFVSQEFVTEVMVALYTDTELQRMARVHVQLAGA